MFAVVAEFASTQVQMKNLPAESVPEWYSLSLTYSLSLILACDRPTVAQKRKKRKAASESGDVEMAEEADAGRDMTSSAEEEDSHSESTVVIRQRTKKAPAKTSNSVAKTSNPVAKRELQESPNRPTPTPKRVKLTTTVIDLADIPVKKLDLSGLEFKEESKLDTTLIPRAAGVVRPLLCLSGIVANVPRRSVMAVLLRGTASRPGISTTTK